MKKPISPIPDPARRRVTITEARSLSLEPRVVILWRPEPTLPESVQYAIVLH